MLLIEPTIQYDKQIQDFRHEYLQAGDSMDGSSHLRRFDETQKWIDQIEEFTTQYLFVREEDSKIVGLIQIRHRFNDFLQKYAGHIGYCVCPSERNKGYAKQMLSCVLPKCQQMGIYDVLICCLSDNEASRKTILANGGIYESQVFEPDSQCYIDRYWIHLSR